MSMPDNAESTTAATATGATGGTILLAAIELIPNDKGYKQFLILLAPTVTVILRSIFLWIQKRVTRSVNLWEDREELNSVKAEIEQITQNGNINEKTKQDLKNKMDVAQVAYIDRKLERLKGKKKK